KFHVDPMGVTGKSDDWRFEIDRGNADRVEQRTVQHRAQDADRILVKQRTHGGDVEAAQDGSVGTPHLTTRRDEPAVAGGIYEAQLAAAMARVGGGGARGT